MQIRGHILETHPRALGARAGWSLTSFVVVVLFGAGAAQAEESESPVLTESSARAPLAGGRRESFTAEPAGYRDAVVAAIQAHRAGQLGEAWVLFGRAHALFPNARTYRGMGVVACDQKHFRECIELLQHALSATVRPLDAELRTATEALRRRALGFVGQVKLTVTPSDGELRVDGVKVDPPNALLLLEPGDHTLSFSARRHQDQQRSLRVRAGTEVELRIKLSPQVPELLAAPARVDRPIVRNPWLWGAVAAVLVGGAIATGMLVNRDSYERGSTGVLIRSEP